MTAIEKEEIVQQILVLNDEMKPLRERLNEIKKQELIEKAKTFVGKCYGFRRSGTLHGVLDGSTWTTYQKVIGVKNECMIVLSCQKYPEGMIEIRTSSMTPHDYVLEKELTEINRITPEEFEKHFNEMITEIRP